VREDDIEITHEWRFEEILFAAYYRVRWLQVRIEQNDLYGIFERNFSHMCLFRCERSN